MCHKFFRRESILFTTKTCFSNEFSQQYWQESFDGDSFVNQSRFGAYAILMARVASILMSTRAGGSHSSNHQMQYSPEDYWCQSSLAAYLLHKILAPQNEDKGEFCLWGSILLATWLEVMSLIKK